MVKRKVFSIRVHPDILEEARERHLNISRICEEALRISLDLKKSNLRNHDKKQQRRLLDKKELKDSEEDEEFEEKFREEARNQKIELMVSLIRENAYEPSLAWRALKEEGLDEVDFPFTKDKETFKNWCKRLEQSDEEDWS